MAVTMERAGKAFSAALSGTVSDMWLVGGDMAGLFLRDKADEMIQGIPRPQESMTSVVGKYAVDAFHNIWMMEYWDFAKKTTPP